jgi:peptidoglycan-associated lipoprotein
MKRQSSMLSTGFVLSIATALILGLSGCNTTTDDEAAPEADTGSEFDDAAASNEVVEETVVVEAIEANVDIDPVYFDYDRSEIRNDSVSTLRDGASQLTNTGSKIVISGHCDSRGSEEYNLALGERRAAGVRRYLANLGVPMRQMTIVSYGEIRPAARGNTEAAWALNRRTEFETAN